MKRPVLILMLCLLAGLLAWWELREVRPPAERPEAGVVISTADTAVKPGPPPASPATPAPEIAMLAAPAAAPAQVVSADDQPKPQDDEKTGPRYKRAYMLRINKGAVTFLEAQDIEGDFSTDREKLDEWSGMLRCRLVSETDAVLAEEVLPAPDYVCTVLDAESKPVTLNPQRPVVFQVRLPRVKGASRLNIYRIVQPGAQPLEGLLASIPLPPS